MGFRNPVTTAVDPTARQAAATAQAAADTALTQIIPGTRLAADAIDGKTITGATFRTAGAASQRVQIDSTNGLVGYNAAGVAVTTVGTDGTLSSSSASVTGTFSALAGGSGAILDSSVRGGSSGAGLLFTTGKAGDTDGAIEDDPLVSGGKVYGRSLTIDPGNVSGYTGTAAVITAQTNGQISKTTGLMVGPYTSVIDLSADTATAVALRLSSTVDASETSTGHAFQIGDDAAQNIVIDNNEIMGRSAGVGFPIFAQYGFSLPTASAITADTSAINRIYLTSRFAAGIVTITPTAANTPTSVTVSFGKTFATPPAVICTPNSTAPGTVVTGVGATGVTTTGFTCWVTRTSTTATGVYWVAVDAAF